MRFLFVLSLLLANASGVDGYKTDNLVLYQPDEVLRERVPSAQALADYYKQVEALAEEQFKQHSKPADLDIVIAIKPARRVKCWFICSDEKLDKELADLRKKVEAIQPLEISGGSFAFAIRGQLAGGLEAKDAKLSGQPIPVEWKEAAKNVKKPLRLPEGFLKLVWPDLPGEASSEEVTPKPVEFVTQVLEPTGGEIVRPKDWFYAEGHHGKTLMWTISAEDSSKGRYVTGVRIQMFAGVKEATGKSPKEFILDFVKGKKDSAKVLEECDETDQGLFTRICLEVEEGDFHVLYSLFWGNEIDMAAVSISGTKKELWSKHSTTFNKMSKFKLIDMKHLEKSASQK